jgi:hypothetical protein
MTPKTGRAQARWLDRIGLLLSREWRYDGITVAVLEGQVKPPELVKRVTDALSLLGKNDARCYRRMKKDVNRIWIKVMAGTIGEYNEPLRTICLDERFVASPNTADSDIAAVIVHEATHARLCAFGVVANERTRARIEKMCFNRELAFASRFQASNAFAEKIRPLQERPETEWTHEKLRALRFGAAPRALKYLGTPEFVTHFLVWCSAMLTRLRRGRAA